MKLKDYLKKLKKIEFRMRTRSHEALAGTYHSAFKGSGMAFDECKTLETLILDEEAKHLTFFQNAFYMCYSFSNIISHNEEPPVVKMRASLLDEGSDGYFSNKTVYVPTGSYGQYRESPYWQNNTIVAGLPEGDIIDEIGNVYAAPITDEKTFYNLQGQKVKNPQKGLYIRNGKIHLAK